MVGSTFIIMVNLNILNWILLNLMMVNSLPLEPGERSTSLTTGSNLNNSSDGGVKDEQAIRHQNGLMVIFQVNFYPSSFITIN